MKLWKRAGPVALSLVLCAGLVLPALAHTVTIDGGDTQQVDTVQDGVNAIEASQSKTGTITMDKDDPVTGDGVTINQGNVTLDLNGHTITNNDRGGAAIIVSGGELTLQDSGTGGKVEATDSYGQGMYVGGGTANILGGEVKAATGYRGGVWVEGGTVNISGGKVSGDAHGVNVQGGAVNISGGTVEAAGESGEGVSVNGGTATISGGTVEAAGESGNGVNVRRGGTATISGDAAVSGGENGVYVGDGAANISGGSVRGSVCGVYVVDMYGRGGTATISGGTVNGGENGVEVRGGGAATISGGSVSGGDRGVYVHKGQYGDGAAGISGDATVTGKTGVQVDDDGAFNMTGGTVGSTVEGGAAVDGTGTITLTGGTLYGSVPDGVDTSDVTEEAAPYDPSAPDPGPDPTPDPNPDPDPDPDPDPEPVSDPLTRPAAAETLLEELFRRAGASGDLWIWAVENGLIDEDADGGEIVTVGLLRAILTRYAEAFGGNMVAVEELTTLTGEDTDVVRSCRAVLNEFFGE